MSLGGAKCRVPPITRKKTGSHPHSEASKGVGPLAPKAKEISIAMRKRNNTPKIRVQTGNTEISITDGAMKRLRDIHMVDMKLGPT